MTKKKAVNKRAKAGSGKKHDKHAPTIGTELAKAEAENKLNLLALAENESAES